MPSTYPIIKLKPQREWPLRNRHHAIYKNGIESLMGIETGCIAEVRSSEDAFLCYATINLRSYICGRAISFEQGDPMAALRKNMKHAIDLRRHLLSSEDTNAIRLINAEGDAIPGLIVDRYGDVIVMQITTLGMDRLRPWLIQTLIELTEPAAIFEKSTGVSRKTEGLEPREEWVKGEQGAAFMAADAEPIAVTERGLKYMISLTGSQKTGLFLDQREMRSLVRSLAPGRTVLDCCSYVGGFSMSALAGGATSADAVDYDAAALERAKEHMKLNGIESPFTTYAEDVFDFLRRKPLPKQYDFVILDPPAFAKRSSDVDQAKGAYTDLNRMGFQACGPGSLMLTCSCSYQIDPPLFQTIVFHAARQANRNVRIIQRHRQAFDHPVNLYHPEVDYLKSLLLWVE